MLSITTLTIFGAAPEEKPPSTFYFSQTVLRPDLKRPDLNLQRLNLYPDPQEIEHGADIPVYRALPHRPPLDRFTPDGSRKAGKTVFPAPYFLQGPRRRTSGLDRYRLGRFIFGDTVRKHEARKKEVSIGVTAGAVDGLYQSLHYPNELRISHSLQTLPLHLYAGPRDIHEAINAYEQRVASFYKGEDIKVFDGSVKTVLGLGTFLLLATLYFWRQYPKEKKEFLALYPQLNKALEAANRQERFSARSFFAFFREASMANKIRKELLKREKNKEEIKLLTLIKQYEESSNLFLQTATTPFGLGFVGLLFLAAGAYQAYKNKQERFNAGDPYRVANRAVKELRAAFPQPGR